MKSVFEYRDYRAFLRDSYESLKTKKSLTYAQLAKLAGLNSPNYFRLVIDGSRNLTVANIHSFAKALRLRPAELEYFEALVHANQAEQPSVRKHYLSRAQKLRSETSSSQRRVETASAVTAQWYAPAVLLLLTQPTKNKPAEIASRLAISQAEVESLEKAFVQKGLIEHESASGRYELSARHLIVNEKPTNEHQRAYLRSQLKRTLEKFDREYETKAKFYSLTFTCAKDGFETYWNEILAFVDRLNQQADADAPEEIMQLNLQFFAV